MSSLTVRAVQPVVRGLEALGHPVDGLLRQSGIAREVLSDSEGRVSQAAMMTLWESAVAVTGDPNLGIHVAERAPAESFEVHVYALLSSPTLREAYRRGCRYQRLIHEVNNLTFEEGLEQGVLRHAVPGGGAVPRQPAEFLATAWVRFGRLVTGSDWSPSLVCFAHPAPADTAEHDRVFRAPVRFSTDGTAVHVGNGILDSPNPHADAGLDRVVNRYAETLLERLPDRSTVSGRLREWLGGALSSGEPSATGAARALSVSIRTLHRRLRDEGATFREVVDGVRRERATTLLADPRYNISEVAFLLGFSEVSSFYRAVKRWTGGTPADLRARRPPSST